MTRVLALLLLLSSLGAAAAAEVRYETIAEGLSYPWSLAFLPDGSMLVTERDGQLRRIVDGRLLPEPVAGVPEVYVAGQGGLFDVLPDPDFGDNQAVYLSYAHGRPQANSTRVARARLVDNALVDLEILFTAVPEKSTPHHYGGRMLLADDGTLLVTVGEGFNYREQAQKLDSHFGTLIRIERSGAVPADNPFVDTPGALPEILSYGHRNAQGIVQAEDGTIFLHEHGPRGGDELNVIEPGANYGWPAVSYGRDYTFAGITPYTELPGMRQPVLVWTPSIAPSGMALYTGDLFPEWAGDLFVTALVEKSVRRVRIDGGRVVADERLFEAIGERLRDIRDGPDGALYVLTDSEAGRIVRITPGGDPPGR